MQINKEGSFDAEVLHWLLGSTHPLPGRFPKLASQGISCIDILQSVYRDGRLGGDAENVLNDVQNDDARRKQGSFSATRDVTRRSS